MVGESNQNVFLIHIDALRFAEFEIFEFEIMRFNCMMENAAFPSVRGAHALFYIFS